MKSVCIENERIPKYRNNLKMIWTENKHTLLNDPEAEARRQLVIGKQRKMGDIYYYLPIPDRRRNKSHVMNELTPLLKEHGFVRSKSSFFRVWGDHLLQAITLGSIWHRSNNVVLYVEPLYGLDISPVFTYSLFKGDDDELVESRTAEEALGIPEGGKWSHSFISYCEDLDSAIEQEKELLQQQVIPLYDKITTAADCQFFMSEYRYPMNNPSKIGISLIRPELLIRSGKIDAAIDELEFQAKMKLEYYAYYVTEFPEQKDTLDPYTKPDYVQIQKKLALLRRGDLNEIHQVMDQVKKEIYAGMYARSKALQKVWPEKPFDLCFSSSEIHI